MSTTEFELVIGDKNYSSWSLRPWLALKAAGMAFEEYPVTLRQRVSSPGGTTIEGLQVMEAGAVRAHIAGAVRAAARRAGEL